MRTHEDWLVLNRGVNRERADQIRARLTRDIRELDPDVPVIIAGVNDIYRGSGAERSSANSRRCTKWRNSPANYSRGRWQHPAL